MLTSSLRANYLTLASTPAAPPCTHTHVHAHNHKEAHMELCHRASRQGHQACWTLTVVPPPPSTPPSLLLSFPLVFPGQLLHADLSIIPHTRPPQNHPPSPFLSSPKARASSCPPSSPSSPPGLFFVTPHPSARRLPLRLCGLL